MSTELIAENRQEHDDDCIAQVCAARPLSRRQWLAQLGAGFGSVALSALLAEESPAAANPLAPRPPHFAARR